MKGRVHVKSVLECFSARIQRQPLKEKDPVRDLSINERGENGKTERKAKLSAGRFAGAC